MPKVITADSRLVDTSRSGETLVVRRLGDVYQSRMTAAYTELGIASLLFLGSVVATVMRPEFWPVIVIFGIVLAVVIVRTVDVKSHTAKEEVFRFDLDRDVIEREGRRLAKASDVDHVLLRRIIRDDMADQENSDYALVVALTSTRRFTVAESEGVSGARSQMMAAADEISRFLSVKVQEGERLPNEEWMDRSAL